MEIGCSCRGEEDGVVGSEIAKLLDDIVRMLILLALALSLPEYSESGDNGEFPPLPGPFRVAELVRAEPRHLLRSSATLL